MNQRTRERRPAGDGAAITKWAATQQEHPQNTPGRMSVRDLAALAGRAGFVVRVASTMTNGRRKLQHYASLHAAVAAQERAEARGCEAHLVLCKVTPVGPIPESVADLAALAEVLGGGDDR